MQISLSGIRRVTFEKWKPAQQKEYLAKHPHSRFRKKAATDRPASPKLPLNKLGAKKVKIAPLKTRIKNLRATTERLQAQRATLRADIAKTTDKTALARKTDLLNKVNIALRRMTGIHAGLHSQLKRARLARKAARPSKKVKVSLKPRRPE